MPQKPVKLTAENIKNLLNFGNKSSGDPSAASFVGPPGAGEFSPNQNLTADIQTLTNKAEAETTRQGRTVSPEEVLQTMQRNNPTLNISVLGTQ